MSQYPSWVCFECGMEARGKPIPEGRVATYHENVCGVCGEYKWVTEPRDFGYPEFKPKGKSNESKCGG